MVSWISFVVPPDVIPGRMGLLITLFLVLVNIFNSVTTNTPKAEGNYSYYTYKQSLPSEMEIPGFELDIHVLGMFIRRHWLYLLFSLSRYFLDNQYLIRWIISNRCLYRLLLSLLKQKRFL